MKTGVEPLDDKRIQAGILASLIDLCFQTGLIVIMNPFI